MYTYISHIFYLALLKAVLRIRDVYPGSQIPNVYPGSQIPDPHKWISDFLPKNLFLSSRNMIRDVHPGSDPGSDTRIRILIFLSIPDPDPGPKKAPDARIRTRNTGLKVGYGPYSK